MREILIGAAVLVVVVLFLWWLCSLLATGDDQ